jgi:GNAT superfamily N-acetyltransferase
VTVGVEGAELPVLDPSSLSAISELCSVSMVSPPTADELSAALFDADHPAIVRGDPEVGVVAVIPGDGEAHIRLLVVHPGRRRRGHGHRLLATAEADARALDHRRLTVGADAPYFLWPGVPTEAIGLHCLLERHRYTRAEANFDMAIPLDDLPAEPRGAALATSAQREEIDGWARSHWPNWQAEILRALDKGNLMVARDGVGVSAICAFEVNRRGFLGPVAARPDLIGRGAARDVLMGALHELRRRGRSSIDVVWVGPIVPYARVGGTISNVYFVYRRELV